MPSAAIVFAAVPVALSGRLRARLAAIIDPFVVAADDGATTALAFSLTPDVVVGDLDSIQPSTLERLGSAKVERYPRDKNATDGQLAIERALQVRPAQLLLIGFLGGPRLDQELAHVLFLTRVDTPAILLNADNEATLLRPGVAREWRSEHGEIVSLIPMLGDVHGIHTRGLRWPLHGDTLHVGDTRGVSNEPIADEVGVSIEAGLLMVTRHLPG